MEYGKIVMMPPFPHSAKLHASYSPSKGKYIIRKTELPLGKTKGCFLLFHPASMRSAYQHLNPTATTDNI